MQHTPGIVNLIQKLKPAYATGNAHKWFQTPKAQPFFTLEKIRQNSPTYD